MKSSQILNKIKVNIENSKNVSPIHFKLFSAGDINFPASTLHTRVLLYKWLMDMVCAASSCEEWLVLQIGRYPSNEDMRNWQVGFLNCLIDYCIKEGD